MGDVYAVLVRQRAGTYSATCMSKRATATAGPEQAARALAVKLWGEGDHRVKPRPDVDPPSDDPGSTWWTIRNAETVCRATP